MPIAKRLANDLLTYLGLTVARLDPLEAQVPADYLRSPFLPAVYRQSLGRLFYFRHMFERVAGVPGDIVECGVSTGHGILFFSLLCELTGTRRDIWGFDSFAGFPPSKEADRKADSSFQTQEHDYASPPEIVLRVLADGRVSRKFVEESVRLVPGYFDVTLQRYQGEIALLHLDCDLFESYTSCLNALYGRVRSGGVIMFDEYEDRNFPGAKVAIDSFFSTRPEKPIVYRDFEYLKYYIVKQ